MSAPVQEPPAPERSPEKGQQSIHEPGPVLAQLSAALENPDIKVLEWSEDGRGVRVHTELYEEEMGRNKELFPELAALGCVAALQAWLLGCGFTLSGAKANAQTLLLQHPTFQRAQPTAKEPGALGGDAGLSTKQQKKRKKKRYTRRLRPPRGATSQDTLRLLQPMSKALSGKGLSASGSSCTSPGRLAPLRPLYQYINFDMPELMHPAAEEDEAPELAQQSQVPAAPRTTTAPQLEGTWTSSAVEMPAPGADDKSMQVDIDRMLRYAAHLVPLLFPQYK